MESTTSEWIEVRQSKVHGTGIFASKDIPEGTKIIEYIGRQMTKSQADKIADRDFESNQKDNDAGAVYLFEVTKKIDIDGNVDYNTARFINHSCDPNCESEIINNHIFIIAFKDIKKGDELNYDYGYDIDDYEDHPCECGAKNCFGYIISEDMRKKLKVKMAKTRAKQKNIERLARKEAISS